MDNKQFLTNDQIDAIKEIVMRDNVYKQVTTSINTVLESDEFKAKFEEIKASDKFVIEYNKAAIEKEKNLKLFNLFKQINEIDSDILKYNDEYDTLTNISWLVSSSEEEINNSYNNEITVIENNIKINTIKELKLNDSWNICNNIKKDIDARLLLTTPGTFDEIINDILKYIDINKYLYTK